MFGRLVISSILLIVSCDIVLVFYILNGHFWNERHKNGFWNHVTLHSKPKYQWKMLSQ